MPITRRQFELEIDPKIAEWMKQIYAFLAEHKDEAFSIDEMESQFGMQGDVSQLFEGDVFKVALQKLVWLGAAQERIIRAKRYYSYGPNPLEF